MKLLTFMQNGQETLGVLTPCQEKIIAISGAETPKSMNELLEGGDLALQKLNDKVARATEFIPISEVKVLAPIPSVRRNIFCVGKNYRAHILEFEKGVPADEAIPKHPIIFTKATHTVTGPDSIVKAHSNVTNRLDYEAELAIVIGKRGSNIPKEQAFDYIFGYTVLNDVTARDLQKKHAQWFLGKSLDTFAPMGPCIVTKDEIADINNVSITCKINGELRQNGNTKDFIFDIPTLIECISAGITLEPGDIIATGTPDGVGIGFNPYKFLKIGDVMEIEIAGIGKLVNTIGE